jgi:hypothetical protein
MTTPNPFTLPTTPHAPQFHTDDVEYFRKLCEATGLSSRAIARRIGVDAGQFRGYLSGARTWPYVVQFAVERLADR